MSDATYPPDPDVDQETGEDTSYPPDPNEEPSEPVADQSPGDTPTNFTASTINADPNKPTDVNDGAHSPGEDFENLNVTVQGIKMNVGFEANGTPGVPGDYLAWANGHWFVLKPDEDDADREEDPEAGGPEAMEGEEIA